MTLNLHKPLRDWSVGAIVRLILSTSQENNIEYTVFAKELRLSIACREVGFKSLLVCIYE